jgi:hypothetical protein
VQIALILALAAVATCDSDSREGGAAGAPLTVVYGPSKPSYRPAPVAAYVSQPRYKADSYEVSSQGKHDFEHM